ncbi:ABC transporter ATP-binding protein [Microbacterium sp.]|uniref:ABC transporter ATP-binding protein n=1 Tax=Microbacterium sp. TaxID=51671 RepID=UPI003C74F25B
MTAPHTHRIAVDSVTLAYDRNVIVENLSTRIPDGGFTAIIGPNGCGKSTLLRSIARILAPQQGTIALDGRDIARHRPKELARQIGLLPQSSTAPEGITVAGLVERGRFPHQTPFAQWSEQDEHAVLQALRAAAVEDLSDQHVDMLSGGQRQRVWIAMTLAQQTGILLLDEPTTFLDISHQIELLELFADLHDQGRTIVAVLHDLNHAARYASHLIVMKHGRIVDEGDPRQILTADLVADVFGLNCVVVDDPETGTPMIVPRARPRRT